MSFDFALPEYFLSWGTHSSSARPLQMHTEQGTGPACLFLLFVPLCLWLLASSTEIVAVCCCVFFNFPLVVNCINQWPGIHSKCPIQRLQFFFPNVWKTLANKSPIDHVTLFSLEGLCQDIPCAPEKRVLERQSNPHLPSAELPAGLDSCLGIPTDPLTVHLL